MTLAAYHREILTQESAISVEVLAVRGYASMDDPEEIRGLGFSKPQSRTAPALAIPLWDVHGQQTGWQIRPDRPRQGKDGKLYKYETPHKGRVSLDIHPSVQPLLGDPSVPLWITEGVKKGDALATQGACAIALMGGVWGFRGTNEHGGKVILPDWEHVALNGRLVYVAFDSDLATKPQVQQALKGLYVFLRSRQAIPARVNWPASAIKIGVDDFLAQGHALEDVLALIPPPGPLPTSPPPPAAGTPAFLSTEKGRPRPVLANVLEVLEKDARWSGVFGYNELTDEVTLLQRPPYALVSRDWRPRALLAVDESRTSEWMQRKHDLCCPTTLVGEGIQAAASEAPYHPIRTYLAELTWDQHPRLDNWLIIYCKAKDTAYTKAVGSKTLIGAVARVMDPGCKVDTVPILEGEQGSLKSTTWRALASDAWFSDALPDLHDKDAAQSLRGKWIIELGELASLQRSEVEAIKRFISANQDHYRPSYGRRAQTFPRQNIFVGSTNRTAYLKDETGNRRFWPVELKGLCDTAALQRDRDQLWAEAYARYRQGEAWYLTVELEALAMDEQSTRVEEDDWEEAILTFVKTPKEGKTRERVTTAEILEEALSLDNKRDWTQVQTKRIGGILRRNRWKHHPYRDENGTLIKGYVRPPEEKVVTGNTEEKSATGNTFSSSKDAVVTSVTNVTSDLGVLGIDNENAQEVCNAHNARESRYTGVFIDSKESLVTTGNTGNTSNGAGKSMPPLVTPPVTTGNTGNIRNSPSVTAPPFPGPCSDTPLRPGQQVWLYDSAGAPLYDTPVRIVKVEPGAKSLAFFDPNGTRRWWDWTLAVLVTEQEE